MLIEVVEAIRPHLQLTFENILSHINTIYVLQTRQGAMSSRHEQRFLRLKVNEFCGLSVQFCSVLFGSVHVLRSCSELISICDRTHSYTHTYRHTETLAQWQHNEMNKQNGRLRTAAAIEIGIEIVH